MNKNPPHALRGESTRSLEVSRGWGLRPQTHPQDPTVSQGLGTRTCPTFALVFAKGWGPRPAPLMPSRPLAPPAGGSPEAKWGGSI